MLKFLISALFLMVFLFVFVLLGSGMLWVVLKLLRSLFPQRFRPSERRRTDEK